MVALSPLQALWMSVIITAAYPVAGKIGAGEVSPAAIVLFGSLLAWLLFMPLLFKNKFWGILFSKDLFFKFSAIGLFGSGLPLLCMFIALNYTTPANAAILNQSEAVYSLILSAWLLKERPCKRQLYGTALVIGGVVLVLLSAGLSIKLKGDLIVLGSVWMFQLSHITAKKLPKNLPDSLITCVRCAYAFLCLLPILFVASFFGLPVYCNISLKGIGTVVFMAVCINIASNLLWYKAIRNMSLAKATAVIQTYPAFTYLISVALGYDKLGVLQILGLVLAMGGAYMVTNTIRKENAK